MSGKDQTPAVVVPVGRPSRGAVLLVTVHAAGALTVNRCGALRSGWSKQAQARRAPSGSKELQT